ncbi:lysophospholipid acyltransferase family protein [candidate division WOR-3 bacterium]|nr:lysophospholipid acyltransferase family protein [candidate division WOR-3 bacterium]
MKLKDRLLLGPGSFFGYISVLLWGKTLSIVTKNVNETLENENNYPAVYFLWHRDMLVPAYFFRNRGYRVLIGRHRDAEFISIISEKLGYRTLRGSSTRGATAAMRNIVKSLEKKQLVVITPDGPKGPSEKIKEGPLFAALKTGAPVIPIIVSYKRCYTFGSWDKFRLAFPFSKVCILLGGPVKLQGLSSRDNILRIKKTIEKKILRLEKVAKRSLC